MTMSDRIAVMNKGRYEQLGDPEVLYERPQTRFVAGFLGISNLLPASREGSSNGYASFRLAGGTGCNLPEALVADRKGNLAVGVRPEKIRLFEPGKDVPPGLNRLDGVITDASYLGVSTQYIVQLADGHRVTVFEQNVERATKSELWAKGENVLMAWAPEHSFVVDIGDAPITDETDINALEAVAS